MNNKSKRRSVAAGILLVLALAAGGAYAYWTNSGTGSGTATTASPAAGQLSVSGDPITGLAPGVAAQTLTGTITNNGSNAFHYSSLSASISVDAGHPGCDSSDYTLVQPSGVSGDLAAGASATFSSGSIAFNNKPSTNQDACKGATVTVSYTVS